MTEKSKITAMPMIVQQLIAMLFIAAGVVSCAKDKPEVATADVASTQPAKLQPALFQDFKSGWKNNASQDGLWKINGVWVATGKNTMDPANVTFADDYTGEKSHGFVSLTSKAGVLKGSEIQTSQTGPFYHYGYYEVRMKLTDVGDPVANTGVCASFFWKREKYQKAEWDIEFLSNGKWINSPDKGQVTMNAHLDNGKSKVHYQDLPFNPSKGFHRYGILWQATRLDWTVDGKIVYSFEDPGVASEPGYIMMNSWTGNKNWGGLAPAKDAVTVYDWVKFYPNVTSIPNDGAE